MKHLTDEQLSALLDDALPASGRAACDAHLAGCDACRARLAEASALDTSLGRALTHDPGEAYFTDFAERVGKRIAAGGVPAPGPKSPTKPSLWNWLGSPRGLVLAGSTAALLATAGIAWMQFHNEHDAARALREAAPSPVRAGARKQSAPGANDEVQRQAPPAASVPAHPLTEDQVLPPAASPPRDLARAQEVRTLPNGERVPVSQLQSQAGEGTPQQPQGNALAAPATGSAIAQMKRRSVAPAAEKEKEEITTRADAQRTNKDVAATSGAEAPAPAPAAMPAPAAAKFAQEPSAQKASVPFSADSARGQSFNEWGASKSLYKSSGANELKSDARKLASLAATCGKVRDSRGHGLAGAQVTAVHDGVRTARTGTDGEFCIDGLKAGDTLTVMHVGFDPYTVVMTPMTSLAITLEPVGTLGPQSTMLTGKPQAAPSLSGALHAHAGTAGDSALAPPPDLYADQSFGIRQLVRDAREATSIARRERTAPSFENAAKQWAAVAGQVKAPQALDARFQYLSALREAYQLEATADRASRLRSACAAFLATAPASVPERATVERWQKEMNAPPGR